MNLAVLPTKTKLKIDSETLFLISELEKSLAQLDILTKFLPEDYCTLLKTIEAINSFNIDNSPTINFEQFFLSKKDYTEIQRQVTSLETALKIFKDVNPNRLIKTLHQEILTNEKDSAGIFREDNVLSETPGKIILPQNVSELMNNLESYLMSDVSYHTFINAAIIHAQFELIHPFGSHNGIAGRALTQLHFVWKRKLTKPILLLSRALLERKIEYFDKLHDIAINANWNSWIKFALEAFLQATKNSIALLEKINSFYRETVSASIKNTFAAPALLKVIEYIKTKPAFTIQMLTASLVLSKQTASIIITKLLEEKIITESTGKQRYRIFKNTMLLDAVSR
ncbi:MAG: filamentation induced by cAMP protein fic [Ignavibacteria bacterium]|nr:MAG: filamentation induced by cAMP protein fic [Ignavibacteria bacterium]KAF0161604.1 MAG: filamentation induced by cAMP protein fic [Ignavibacteria bacterium]